MSGNDLTTEAVRLAMSMSQLQAEYASQNIGRAGTPGAQATRLDFSRSVGLLQQAAGAGADAGALLPVLADAAANPASVDVATHEAGIDLDEQVADMATANLKFQALAESLNRHFGLMRLAITGRN
jgi:flagellar basal body rod protein FlgB